MASALSSSTRRWLAGLAVTFLLALHFGLGFMSARHKAVTADEPFHLGRGVSALFSGDFRLNVSHPPLFNLWNALPLLFVPDLKIPYHDPYWQNPLVDDADRKYRFAMLFLWKLNPDPLRLITLARIPTLLASVLLAGMVFLWARRLYGNGAGLFALFLYSLSPNLLAHAPLITTDLGVSLTIFLAAFFLWRHLAAPSWPRLLLAGFFLGLAQLSKFTAIFLYPLDLLILWLALPGDGKDKLRSFFTMDPRRSEFLRGLGAFLVMFAAATFMIWAGYGFEIHSLHNFDLLLHPPASPELPATSGIHRLAVLALSKVPIPPPTYYYGLARTINDTGQHLHPLYFLGRLSTRGWWYYYPVLALIKLPLAVFVLLALRIFYHSRVAGAPGVAGARSAELTAESLTRNHIQADRLTEITLLALILGLLVFFMVLNEKNIGIRHLLPILPLLYVYLARLWLFAAGRRALRWLVLGLLAWYGLSSLAVYPDYLVYFNELAGGPEAGLKISVVGEDWGQDVAGLGQWMKANGVEEVFYTPYGSADPRAYGVNYQRIPCGRPAGPGIYALHIVEKLRPLEDRPPDCYQWLDKFQPIAKIGHTIWIYQITEQDLALPP